MVYAGLEIGITQVYLAGVFADGYCMENGLLIWIWNWSAKMISWLNCRSTSGRILQAGLGFRNLLAPSGTGFHCNMPALRCSSIHAFNIDINDWGALKVGVFNSFVGSFGENICRIFPTDGISSGSSLMKHSGKSDGKSGTSYAFGMEDLW